MNIVSKASEFFNMAQAGISYLYHNGKTQKEPLPPLDIEKTAMDPLSLVISLGLLYFQDIGTKTHVEHYRIHFQEPSKGQALIRAYQGDSRDSCLMYEPLIQKAIEMYRPNENPQVQRIFLLGIAGLKVHRETYKHSQVTVEMLNRLIQTIYKGCTTKFEEAAKEGHQSSYYAKVKGLWSGKEIETVYNLICKLPSFLKFLETEVQEKEQGERNRKEKGSAAASAEVKLWKGAIKIEEPLNPQVANILPIQEFLALQAENFEKIVREEVVNLLLFKT